MKNKLIVLSAIFLISVMVAGGTFAWFASSSKAPVAQAQMGTVDVEVIQKSLENIRIKNTGTSESYIRVRLIPQWSDSSLSVSNININTNEKNWVEKDGYYYYKYSVKENKKTANLINNLELNELESNYEGTTFTLKVVAEGVQSAHQAWKDVWNIPNLPF